MSLPASSRRMAAGGRSVGMVTRLVWIGGGPAMRPAPRLEDRCGGRDQRCSSFLSALADRVHVGAGGERDVLTREGGEFRDPQAGLGGESEHGVVAPAGPGGLVAGVQQ